MNENTKRSTTVGLVGGGLTAASAAGTASAVVGGSAATIMSATSGTAGAALAASVGAAGTTGAAAIASGMATIGGVVGGGMATGAIITAAAPVAIAAGVIYGISCLFD